MEEKPEVKNPNVSKKSHKIWAAFAALIVIVLVFIGLFFSQKHTINNLHAKVASLDANVKSLNGTNIKLKSMNSNLSKSYIALQNEESKSATSSSSSTSSDSTSENSAEAQATTSLTITSVKVQSTGDFGSTMEGHDQDNLRVVYFTIKNLGKSTQSYSSADFKAISATGEVISPLVIGGPTAGTFWYGTSITAGGSATAYLPFDVNQSIVTLQFTPEGSSQPTVTVPIPTT